jgi:hypothetical protein
MAICLLPDALEESNETNRWFNRTFEQLEAAYYALVPNPGHAMFAEWVFLIKEEDKIREEHRPGRYYQYGIAAEPMLVYGATVPLINFVGAPVSLQTNARIGSTWLSNDPTSRRGLFYQLKTIGLYTGVSREPISGYEALRRFGLYARTLITKQGIKLVSTNIRDWASLEDPNWKQSVIDFEIEAPSDIALALWDRLNDELEDFIATLEGKLRPDLLDLISITVQWK